MSMSHNRGTRFAVRQASQQNLTDSSEQTSMITPEARLVNVSSQLKEKTNKTMLCRSAENSLTKHSKQKIPPNKIKPGSISTNSSVVPSSGTANDSSLSKTNTTAPTSKNTSTTDSSTSSSSIRINPVAQVLSTTDSVGLKDSSNKDQSRSNLVNVNKLMLDFKTKIKEKDDLIKELKNQVKILENKLIDLQESSMSKFFFSKLFKSKVYIYIYICHRCSNRTTYY